MDINKRPAGRDTTRGVEPAPDARLLNRDAEAALLATGCFDETVAERIAAMEPGDFTVAAHREIQAAIRAAHAHTGGQGITPELVAATLQRPLPSGFPAPVCRTTAMGYAGLLTELAWRRHTSSMIAKVSERLTAINDPVATLEAYRALSELDLPPGAADEMDFDLFTADHISKQPKKKTLLRSGFRAFDEAGAWRDKDGVYHLGGLSTGSLICPAATTNGGKSRFSIELANRMLMAHYSRHKQRRTAMFFSGEMDGGELLDAGGCNPAVPTHRWCRAYQQAGFDTVPLMVLSQSDIGAIDIHGVIDRFVGYVKRTVRQARAAGISNPRQVRELLPLVVVIDYGALYVPAGMDLTKGLGEVFWRAKQLALGTFFNKNEFPELDVYAPAVIMPAQLKEHKESAQKGITKLPTLDDFEWSRTLVNHIDVGILLGPDPDTWNPTADDGRRLAVVGKNRGGAQLRGGFPLVFKNGQWADTEEQIGRPWLGYSTDIVVK